MNFINENANIFFFVTTILVTVLILIFTIILIVVIKFYKFVVKVLKKGDNMLEETKTNEFVKKSAPMVLPIILPIISFFMKKKSKGRK